MLEAEVKAFGYSLSNELELLLGRRMVPRVVGKWPESGTAICMGREEIVGASQEADPREGGTEKPTEMNFCT